jgi:hypothetical protein
MLTATLDALATKFSLEGEVMGEVAINLTAPGCAASVRRTPRVRDAKRDTQHLDGLLAR